MDFKRLCTRCGIDKLQSEFYNGPTYNGKTYRNLVCRQCFLQRAYLRRQTYPRLFWAQTTLSHHRRSGYQTELTYNELSSMANDTNYCFICDSELDWSSTKKVLNSNSPSLDRTNNDKIITKDNARIICYKCNATKLNRTMEEFISYCSLVSRKFTGV